jgi:hypothetical protein
LDTLEITLRTEYRAITDMVSLTLKC